MTPFVPFAAELGVLLIYCAIVLFVVKSKFWRRVLLIAYFTLILSNIASLITETEFFSVYVYPENLALKDFDITDYAVANMREPVPLDDRIVLLNFGNLTRGQTGSLINLISSLNPRVIGLNAIYNCEAGQRDTINCPQLKDTLGNKILREAIKKAGNVVLGSKLFETTSFDPSTSSIADSLEVSDFQFVEYASQGFVTLPTSTESHEDIRICRTFFPSANLKGKIEFDFGVQVAKMYNPKKVDILLQRKREEEIINFRRNIDLSHKNSKYKVLDLSELISSTDLEKNRSLIEGKIIIIGYLGDTYGDEVPSQQFYTPLNSVSAGRSLPDMFGMVVYANIISMVLDEDYINVLPEYAEIIIAFFSCLIHVAILMLLTNRFPKWFEILSVGLILAQLFIYSWLRINLFILFGLKLNLFLTITSLAIATISISLCRELYHLSYKKLPVWLQQKI
jgi:CHASE2 domain-containing sensor protein